MPRFLDCPVWFISLTFVTLAVNSAAGKAPSVEAKKNAPKKALSTAKAKTGTRLLWDSWYTVSIGGALPYGYYHDKIEEKEGKIAFQNQYWKKEEGFINEEQLITFSENSELLPPLLFNFKSNYRGSAVNIDGTFTGSSLSVKVRKDKGDLPKIERTVAKGAFLSSQFPVWLGKHLSQLKVGKKETFSAILEDNVDRKYQPVGGSVILEADDENAKKTSTKKLSVDYNDQKSVWYVHETGETERIDILGTPGAQILVEKSSEAVVRRFLMEK